MNTENTDRLQKEYRKYRQNTDRIQKIQKIQIDKRVFFANNLFVAPDILNWELTYLTKGVRIFQ